MRKMLLIAVFSVLMLVGCSEQNETEVSPLFEAGNYSMIGEENRIGFIYDDREATKFKSNTPNKYMWHFWGEPEELEGKFKVIGTNTDTDEEVTVLEADGVGTPNNGADAHLPSHITLPSAGIWQLDAFIGDNLFGTIVVEVAE